jgi:hypothetical protein
MFFRVVLTLLILTATTANAEIALHTSIFYQSSETETSEYTEMFYSLGLGSVGSSGFYWGAIYRNQAYGDDTTRTSYGASVGFVTEEFGLIAHYFLSSKYDTGTAISGSGFGVDLFYLFKLGSVGIGPMFAWQSYTYDKDENGNDLLDPVKVTLVDPFLMFLFKF